MARVVRFESDTHREVCFHCRSSVCSPRQFSWDCRPRRKDLEQGYVREQLTLELLLCDQCYNYATYDEPDHELVGWDVWDALDGLYFPPQVQQRT